MEKAKKQIERIGRKALAAVNEGDLEKAGELSRQIREIDPSGVVLQEMIKDREKKPITTKRKVYWGHRTEAHLFETKLEARKYADSLHLSNAVITTGPVGWSIFVAGKGWFVGEKTTKLSDKEAKSLVGSMGVYEQRSDGSWRRRNYTADEIKKSVTKLHGELINSLKKRGGRRKA